MARWQLALPSIVGGARHLALLLTISVCCRGAPVTLDLASSDISWSTCRSMAHNQDFPGVCTQNATDPLHVVVTVKAAWRQVLVRGRAGPAVFDDAVDPKMVVVTEGEADKARRLWWRKLSGDSMAHVLPYDAMSSGMSGYGFNVTENSLDVDGQLQSMMMFSVLLPESGDFEVAFDGCCRWVELINMPTSNSFQSVPWQLSSTIKVSATGAGVPSASPRASMPVAQIVLSENPTGDYRPAFSLSSGADGVTLDSILEPGPMADISGRYYAMEGKYHLSSSVSIVADSEYEAYMREDGMYAIAWFQSPSSELQYHVSGAYAYGPTWAVVRGTNFTSRVGQKPVADCATFDCPVLEALGGVWAAHLVDQGWATLGPSYEAGAVGLLKAGTPAVVQYEHLVQIDAVSPQDALLPPYGEAEFGAPTFRLAAGEELGLAVMGRNPASFSYLGEGWEGLWVDAVSGMVSMPAARLLSGAGCRRWPEEQLGEGNFECTVAVSVVVSSAVPGGGAVAVPVDFWVQVVMVERPGGALRVPTDASGLNSSAAAPMVAQCEAAVSLAAVFKAGEGSGQTIAHIRPYSLLPFGLDPATALAVAGLGSETATATLSFTPPCGSARHRGLRAVCMQAVAADADPAAPGALGHLYSMPGCVYIKIEDPSATTPAPSTTPAPPPPPPPPPPPTTAPPPATPPPPPSQRVHVLDSQLVLPDPQAQLQQGFLELQFIADAGLLPYTANMQAFAVHDVCAGGRGLEEQRRIIDAWNKEKNGMGVVDAPARGIAFRLGPEQEGQRQAVEGAAGEMATYEWACVQPWRALLLQRSDEMQRGGAPYDCLWCWKPVATTA